jgi:hypothetical protein
LVCGNAQPSGDRNLIELVFIIEFVHAIGVKQGHLYVGDCIIVRLKQITHHFLGQIQVRLRKRQFGIGDEVHADVVHRGESRHVSKSQFRVR